MFFYKAKEEVILMATYDPIAYKYSDGDDVIKLDRFVLQMKILKSGYGPISDTIDAFDQFDNYVATKRVPISHKENLYYGKR